MNTQRRTQPMSAIDREVRGIAVNQNDFEPLDEDTKNLRNKLIKTMREVGRKAKEDDGR